MSMETRLIALAQALGADIKLVNTAIALGVTERGDLSTLTTTAKTSLVAALNEVNAAIAALSAGAAGIDDAATDGNTTSTWSADKIYDELIAAKQAVKNEILDGAGAALDTLNELATALGNDANFAASMKEVYKLLKQGYKEDLICSAIEVALYNDFWKKNLLVLTQLNSKCKSGLTKFEHLLILLKGPEKIDDYEEL